MKRLRERDIDCLIRILDCSDPITGAVERFGNHLNIFCNDPDYRDAVKMNLFQIGENAKLLSEEAREELGEIPWHQIIGLRNIIAHAYVKIDDRMIWGIVKKDLPDLVRTLNDHGIV